MRSKLITATLGSASLLFAPFGATAASDEQIRLLEQRMAEMEDRLEATSSALKDEKENNLEQRVLLEQAGLVEEDAQGARSKVGKFLEMVNVSGIAAASYNYRFIDAGDNDSGNSLLTSGATNDPFFTHKNGDSFQLDQLWITLDKAPTEESRAGFHADYIWGETAEQQALSGLSRDAGRDSGILYTGYVSYLAPIGNGIRFDAGKLATTLGVEVLQTNMNLTITEGVVFQKLQPFTYTGVSATTQVTDNLALVLAVVNEVYRDTNISSDRDKAGMAQLRFSGDTWGFNVGGIVGQDPTAPTCNADLTDTGDDCNTSVFDVNATIKPAENIVLWANFDWVRYMGSNVSDGDKFGFATAGRVGITDDTGIAARFEYLTQDEGVNLGVSKDQEYITVSGVVDHSLTEGLVIRGELRYDKELKSDGAVFLSGNEGPDSLVALAQMYYQF